MTVGNTVLEYELRTLDVLLDTIVMYCYNRYVTVEGFVVTRIDPLLAFPLSFRNPNV